MKRVLITTLPALAVLLTLQAPGAYAASPAESIDSNPAPQEVPSSKVISRSTEQRINDSCVNQLVAIDPSATKEQKSNYCGSTVTTTVTEPWDRQPRGADPNNVKYRKFYQEEVSNMKAWKVHHEGLWYFDGKVAWIDSQFGWDAHGSHSCKTDHSFGYGIEQLECGKWGDAQEGMWVSHNIKVSMLFNGFPVENQINMKINLGNNGSSVPYKDR